MLRSLGTSDSRSPDSSTRTAWSLDSEPARITFSAALEAFLTARAAEGASPATVTWYRMVLHGSPHAGPPSELGLAGNGGHRDPAPVVTDQADLDPEVQTGRRQDPRLHDAE